MNLNDITAIIHDKDKLDFWYSMEHKGAQRYIYSLDVNLHIISKYDEDLIVDDFKEPWANGHPDPYAASYAYNIYYGSTLVKYVVLVSVDGGRASLPLPDHTTKTPRLFDFRVAQITHGNSLYEYMERSKLNFPEGA